LELSEPADDQKNGIDPERNPCFESASPADDQKVTIDHGTVRDQDFWTDLGCHRDLVNDRHCGHPYSIDLHLTIVPHHGNEPGREGDDRTTSPSVGESHSPGQPRCLQRWM
jgi:hypothetical protein